MLLPAVAVAAQAQRDSTRVRVNVRSEAPGERTFVYSMGPRDFQFDMRRGRLGITVDLRPDAARDTVGARVAGVTPGGPAERAGVQAGDLITRFNGARLAVTDARGDADSDQSGPGMRLINMASRLNGGDTVRLDLRRDARTLTVTFPAGATDMDVLVERMRVPGGQLMPDMVPGSPFGGDGPGGGQMRVFVNGYDLNDLELVRVNPQLAEGLGISEGLLVVDVGRDTALGLRAGDVILTIGGRRPSSPPHAMRILSTYEPGESVQLEVMRQRRRVTVTGRLPARSGPQWRIRPNSFEFDMPRMTEPMMRLFEHDMPHIQMRRPDGPPKALIRHQGEV